VETAAPHQDLGSDLPTPWAGVAASRSKGDGETRHDAQLRAFWLARDAQGGSGEAAAAIDRLIDDAEHRGWPEVVLCGLYAACALAIAKGDQCLPQAIERLRLRAEIDADAGMEALALAMRARSEALNGQSIQSVAADADLARATVMLESAEGGSLQRATAHNSCAIVYGQRRLWELEDQQYAAAEGLLSDCADSPLPSTVLFNRAELQLDWACAMREIGDIGGVEQHCRAGALASAAAKQVVGMPPYWHYELLVIDALLAAVGGADVADEARALLVDDPGGSESPAGSLHLAIALGPGPAETVTDAAERAVESISPGLSPSRYDLALRIAAELEAAASNGQSAGLRCAQHQIELRWNNRLSTLMAMESLLEGERRRTEHDRLNRHAHLDELTGLANRRGLERYLAEVRMRGSQQVAMLVVDVDDFKQVNDRHGHRAGDDTLVGLAAILTANIRPGDLAARMGGDEFALILADTDLLVAARRADDIVDAMNAMPWHQPETGEAVTVSVGLAAGHPEEIAEIAARADAAMYQAKAAGGSRTASG
jgi:diguanylate cyclase (GGDEF)-like protein